jgi:DNA-binding NtrC family response regulator
MATTSGAARLGPVDPVPIGLLGESVPMVRVREFVRRAAGGESGVLITAEEGSAAGSVARALHTQSRQAGGPFVACDCGAGENARIDHALFGAADSTATDLEPVAADSLVARARGGTLFLDGVTELPASAQARLARVARDGEVRIAGDPQPTMCRMIATASPAIDSEVAARRFRADLYRRISSIRIDVPPLRERQEDAPVLAVRLLADACDARGVARRSFSHAALALVGALSWPGNVLELQEVVERVVADTSGPTVHIEHLVPALRLHRAAETVVPSGSLREARQRFERDYIASVLQHHDWHMANAAQALGIQRPNLYRKARQLGIPLTRVTD